MIPADVHPQVKSYLRQVARAGLPAVQELDPAAAREQFEAATEVRRRLFPPPPVAEVAERAIPGPAGPIPVRAYRDSEARDQPLLAYFHGGGHVIGSLDTHDAIARNLCRRAGCTVVSVDYRMGPEHRFPAAVDDCFAVVRWLAEHGADLGADPARLAVGGDSAGGNLAAVTALLAREHDGPALCHQLLVYPVADYRCRGASYERYARGYGLEAESMRWFRRHYLGDPAADDDWRASPLLASDHRGLPPALVITAECDVLRDEGVAYAERLAASGTKCEHAAFPGVIHGFFGLLGVVDAADEAHARAARALRSAFAT